MTLRLASFANLRSGWMRTPNCACMVCGAPLYRRPSDLAKVRHVACMAHRAEAQKLSGITPAQQAGLSQGRRKGTNNRTGYRHRDESRRKASNANKAWCAANPGKVAARGEKTRGEAHYRWDGGVSKLAQSIRRMTEYRRWADAIRNRDGCCVQCGSTSGLESHHKRLFSDLLRENGINNRNDARTCAALWDISNGETLCQRHHYEAHGRTHANQRNHIQEAA